MVHTAGDPLRVVPSLRREMTALDGGAYLLQLHRLEDLVRDSAGRMNAAALLAVSLAAVSLLLAAIGIFGVLSHAVRERTREIGLRAALGADTADVAALVLRPALLAVSAGLIVGLSISAGLVQSLRALLFGVDPLDAMTFAAAGFVLVLIAALAASVPLRRALRLVPMIALRHE